MRECKICFLRSRAEKHVWQGIIPMSSGVAKGDFKAGGRNEHRGEKNEER